MNSIVQVLQHVTIWELCLVFWVIAELVIHYFVKTAPSGFEDEDGFHESNLATIYKLKHELEAADKQIKLLEEAHQDIYEMGFSAGNLSAIKTIGKEMIEDHVRNIEDLEELPNREKMGHKSKQLRSKRIHMGGVKMVDMNVLKDQEVGNAKE
jgi:hypothetical protein